VGRQIEPVREVSWLLVDVIPGHQQYIEMNQEYFGNWKALGEKMKTRGAIRSCVVVVVPFLKTKVPVNRRSNAR